MEQKELKDKRYSKGRIGKRIKKTITIVGKQRRTG